MQILVPAKSNEMVLTRSAAGCAVMDSRSKSNAGSRDTKRGRRTAGSTWGLRGLHKPAFGIASEGDLREVRMIQGNPDSALGLEGLCEITAEQMEQDAVGYDPQAKQGSFRFAQPDCPQL